MQKKRVQGNCWADFAHSYMAQVGWLSGWLAGLVLAGWPAGPQAGWLADFGWLAAWLLCRLLVGWLASCPAGHVVGRLAGCLAGFVG